MVGWDGYNDLEWGPVRWGEWKPLYDNDGRVSRVRVGISYAFDKSPDGVNTTVYQRIYTMTEYRET